MLYELINLLPDDTKKIICMYCDVNSDNLLLLFRLNSNIMLINKQHYEYNYQFYIINSKLNSFKKHLDYILFILRKNRYYLFKNYISNIEYDFLKKNKKINYKNINYINLLDFIKQNIIKYDCNRCLDLIIN